MLYIYNFNTSLNSSSYKQYQMRHRWGEMILMQPFLSRTIWSSSTHHNNNNVRRRNQSWDSYSGKILRVETFRNVDCRLSLTSLMWLRASDNFPTHHYFSFFSQTFFLVIQEMNQKRASKLVCCMMASTICHHKLRVQNEEEMWHTD